MDCRGFRNLRRDNRMGMLEGDLRVGAKVRVEEKEEESR